MLITTSDHPPIQKAKDNTVSLAIADQSESRCSQFPSAHDVIYLLLNQAECKNTSHSHPQLLNPCNIIGRNFHKSGDEGACQKTFVSKIYSVLERLAKVLNIQFDSRHVSVVHRLPLRSNQEHPNIVVKFVRREEKSAWIRAAREHRRRLNASVLFESWSSTPVFINEHLTPHYKAVLDRARRLVTEKRLAFAWTRDCRVYVKKTSQPDSPATLLCSPWTT
ncbi:hypothetical protein J6590_045641 [Homalodisca vitripennis]|nr:hypothetical protein J6590_045641 [Homalodisca vitripennis]